MLRTKHYMHNLSGSLLARKLGSDGLTDRLAQTLIYTYVVIYSVEKNLTSGGQVSRMDMNVKNDE